MLCICISGALGLIVDIGFRNLERKIIHYLIIGLRIPTILGAQFLHPSYAPVANATNAALAAKANYATDAGTSKEAAHSALADLATNATTATDAKNAAYATSAGVADSAKKADSATNATNATIAVTAQTTDYALFSTFTGAFKTSAAAQTALGPNYDGSGTIGAILAAERRDHRDGSWLHEHARNSEWPAGYVHHEPESIGCELIFR